MDIPILDTGAHLQNAKKHLAATYDKNNIDLSLKRLWPEPDWADWCDFGLDVEVAARLYAFYHGIRRTPMAAAHGISDEQWADAYVESIAYMQTSFESTRTMEDIESIKDNFDSHMGLGPNSSNDISEVYVKFAAGRGNGATYRTPFTLTRRLSKLKDILPKLGWPYSINASDIKTFPLKTTNRITGDSSWSLWRISGDSFICDDNSVKYKTEDEALIALFKGIKQKNQPYAPKKNLDRMRGVGEHYPSISPQAFIDAFSFRGVQFGNSMPMVERATYLKNAHYSLRILSKILGIPEKWLGLGGLGIAFGARGQGGASAHYEPSLHIINLTRFSGAGSIAHEWFHALDARMALTLGHKGVLLSTVTASYKSIEDQAKRERYKAFYDLRKTLSSYRTDFYARSKNLSAQKGSQKYWTKKSELMARAFESYIQDQLEVINAESEWLAYGTVHQNYDKVNPSMFPYPQGAERTELNASIKTLLKSIWGLPH